jgi:hypothetical protein
MGIEDLRTRLMSLLAGAVGIGCGPSIVPPDEGGELGSSDATTSDAAASAGVTSTSGPATSGPVTSADADSSTEPPRYDVGGMPPPPPEPPLDCPPQPLPPAEQCTAELPPGKLFQFYCVELGEGETCGAWAQAFEEAPAPGWSEMVSDCLPPDRCEELYLDAIGCGPLPDVGDQCCFWFIGELQLCPPEGRPFVVDGCQRLATLVERGDWSGLTDVAASSSHRAAIAAAWAEQARSEHASIASFSRFILQLLACGASASLVSAAHVALGEEIEHARLFFALASHFAGRTVGPAALDVQGALAGSDDLDEIVLATVREGCIAETLSAWRITVAASVARDPSLAAALARVAEQELEHAALAWRFLAWALPLASASLRHRIEATFHEPARYAPGGPTLAADVPDAEWLAHGILPPCEHAAATRHGLRELVAPIARSLLSAHPVRARPPAITSGPSA